MKKETKGTIIIGMLGISFVSFIVIIWSIFIHLSIWGFYAIPVFGLSFSIALIMAFPYDNRKPNGGRDLG